MGLEAGERSLRDILFWASMQIVRTQNLTRITPTTRVNDAQLAPNSSRKLSNRLRFGSVDRDLEQLCTYLLRELDKGLHIVTTW